MTCTVIWPSARASAAVTVLAGKLYMYGGYSSFYPYPYRDAAGAEIGTAVLRTGGDAPYASLEYYLDDFWEYDFGRYRTTC